MTAERVLILFEGDEPEAGEIDDLVELVEREAGDDLVGVRVSTHHATEPAESLVGRLEREGEVGPDALRRLTTYTVEAVGGRRMVAALWVADRNAWVRQTIPQHLARVDGLGIGLARRPGWARLATETAMSFVAAAADGAGRQFPDVHIVVSVLPESRPRRIRRLMTGGYIRWVDGVFHRAGVPLGEIDVAHWLVCGQRVVHLAYLPADLDTIPLLPWELLSRAEKRGGSKVA